MKMSKFQQDVLLSRTDRQRKENGAIVAAKSIHRVPILMNLNAAMKGMIVVKERIAEIKSLRIGETIKKFEKNGLETKERIVVIVILVTSENPGRLWNWLDLRIVTMKSRRVGMREREMMKG